MMRNGILKYLADIFSMMPIQHDRRMRLIAFACSIHSDSIYLEFHSTIAEFFVDLLVKELYYYTNSTGN